MSDLLDNITPAHVETPEVREQRRAAARVVRRLAHDDQDHDLLLAALDLEDVAA